MRIAFLGHDYHLKTRSDAFFLDLLRRCGEVETFVATTRDHEASGDWSFGFRQRDYDCIVVYQASEAFRYLDEGHPNVVFVPMYDAMVVDGALWWKAGFSEAKVLCFSATLYREVAALAPIHHFAHYYPDPSRLPVAAPAGDGASGFFWYRRPPLTPAFLEALTGRTVFDRMTIHWAPDPVGLHHDDEARGPRARRRERTAWFPDHERYLECVAGHSVYFAPRLFEGIGIGFLEAMAMGLCVVAPARPTHDEYISHGTNGLLYSPSAPAALSFADHRRLGERAREHVARGRRLWEAAEAGVQEFLVTPKERLERRPALIDFWRRAQAGAETPEAAPEAALPKVTVVTVCLDAATEIEPTLTSVAEQDYPVLEYVVVDGGSTDGTLAILDRHAATIDTRESRPGRRIYTSMMDALAHTTGDWVLFLNAGDAFASPRALRALFARLPEDADVVYGHHLYLRTDGVDELRCANDLEQSWRDLRRGRLTRRWLRGLPCHQAVAVRSSRLREFGFDPALRIAADQDLLFRLRRAGARCHHSAEVVVHYLGGGFSERFFTLCAQEWLRVAVRHGRAAPARRFYRALGLEGEELWTPLLQGWIDRLRGRARRRFGAPPALGSGSAVPRPPATARALESFARWAGQRTAALERRLRALRRDAQRSTPRSGTETGIVYPAQPEEGIDFSRHGRPSFVTRWSGLSFREEWGRWSDGRRVEIHFEAPLPAALRLELEACAFEDNARLPMRVSAGVANAELRLSSAPIASYSVELDTSGTERVLVLHIPAPTAPALIWPGKSSDSRRLGIALGRLRVLDRRPGPAPAVLPARVRVEALRRRPR